MRLGTAADVAAFVLLLTILVMASQRILFMGTGDIALPSFGALLESEYEVIGLVTQPDKPVGRKRVVTPPAIKGMAEDAGVKVLQPEKVRESVAEISALEADVIVVMAYGQILPKSLIALPRVAIVNLHASLLPKYRGASCIQAAIDAGDEVSGMTVMHVVSRLDAGDVILRKPVEIGEKMTGGELHDVLAEVGPGALMEALEGLFDGTAEREGQDEVSSSYAPKLMRGDGELDWGMKAEEIERRVRAYWPWPGTSTCFKDGKGRTRRLKIFPQVEVVEGRGDAGEVISVDGDLIVACGEGAVRLGEVQAEGGRRMTAEEFLKGSPIRVGSRFFCLAPEDEKS